MRCAILAVVAATGLLSDALGQGTAKWRLLEGSGTPDGDFVIDEIKGETDITFVIGIDLTPSSGEALEDGSKVVGFGSVIADFIGIRNWERGDVTWTMNPDLIFLTGDLTRKDEKSQNLYDMNAGQVPGFGPFSSADPIWVTSINWKIREWWEGSPSVSVAVDTQGEDTIQAYVRKPGGEFDDLQTWGATDGVIDFSVRVIPSPGNVLPLLLGGVAMARPRANRTSMTRS